MCDAHDDDDDDDDDEMVTVMRMRIQNDYLSFFFTR